MSNHLDSKHWHYACSYVMHYSTSDLAPNIHMSGPYKCTALTCWTPVGNTAMKTYLKKDSVTTTVNNRVYLSFYLCLLYFYYSRTITYFLREAFFETDFAILDHMALSFLISLKILKSSERF